MVANCLSLTRSGKLIDSVEYYKKTILSKHTKKSSFSGKSLLKSGKNKYSESEGDNPIFNSSSARIKWNDTAIDDIKNLDNASVRDASKKYGLPSVIEKCVTRGDIALTFDDGISLVTQKVLNILRKENVKATFFVLGNTLDSPVLGENLAQNILRQMLRDGHVIGSHSYSHPNFDEYWPEGIQHEMNRSKELFKKHIRKAPRFMRPPFGNATPQTIQALNDLGYFIIRWNLDTNDWMYINEPEKTINEFSKKLPDEVQINNIRFQKSGLTELGIKTMINNILDSKIALMHDIHLTITSFLSKLINHARYLGYKFVSMDECLGGIDPYFNEDL